MRFLFIIALVPSLLFGQSTRDSLTIELTELAGDSAIVGFAVSIIDLDGILYSHGFGYSDRSNQIPYTTKTVQPIASISKTLLGISLMKAQELRLLELDDDINKHLPFRIVNPNAPESKITIRMLANHTSSLRDTKHYEKSYVFASPIPKVYKDFPPGIRRIMIRRMVRMYNKNSVISLTDFLLNIYTPDGKWYSKKSFGKEPPGHIMSYSNNGAAIASLIISSVSGMTYTDFVTKHILEPLEMENSGWHLSEYGSEEKSKLYPFQMEIPDYELITIADGGLITNIDDFSKYLGAVIRGYNGEDNVLKSDSFSMMLRKKIFNDQGIFWNTREMENENYIGHTGGDPGVQTFAFFDKKTNLGYISFSNTNTFTADELDRAVRLMVRYSRKNGFR